MSDAAPAKHEAAHKMGFKDGDLIQELGYDDDVDFDLRDSLEEAVGSELLTEEDHEVVDGIIYWWRDDDGDLIDALVDSLVVAGVLQQQWRRDLRNIFNRCLPSVKCNARV